METPTTSLPRVTGFILIGAMLALLLSGCGSPSDSDDSSSRSGAETPSAPSAKVTLGADWLAVPEQAGFFAALVEGYYADAGLDLTIQQGGPFSPPNYLAIAKGQMDFGLNEISRVVRIAERGVPVKMIMAYYQKTPLSVMVRAESPVETIADIGDMRLIADPGEMWLAWARAEFGINPQIQPLQPTISLFLEDETGNLGQQAFVTNEPYHAEKNGVAVRNIMFTDHGFPSWRGIVVSHDYAEQHPERVRAFVKATILGWARYAAGERASADAEIQRRNPEMTPDYFVYVMRQLEEREIMLGRDRPLRDLGRIDLAAVEEMIALLHRHGIISEKPALDAVATNEFLPEAAWWDEHFGAEADQPVSWK